MNSNLLSPLGSPIEISALTLPKAIELANALQRRTIDYAEFVEVRTTDGREIVVFDVDVELPQRRIHSIARRERIASVFLPEDLDHPEVLALRRDFPYVLHLNLRDEELPRSLCLFDESYRNTKRYWTASRFVVRIREWLALTAKGGLHQDDQPLEPLLMDTDGILLLSSNAFSNEPNDITYQILRPQQTQSQADPKNIISIFLTSEPLEHGVIRRRPNTLTELSDMLASAGINLLPELRARLQNWYHNKRELLNWHLVLLVQFPKTRSPEGPIEAIEQWAFHVGCNENGKQFISAPIAAIGQSLGVWEKRNSDLAYLLPIDSSKTGDDLLLEVLNPILRMNPTYLAKLNGLVPASDMLNLCAVGVGALGSQIVLNLARAGFGRWTLIDDDFLLPHNLARHILPGEQFVGKPKCESVALFANSLTNGEDLFKAIPTNIFNPDNQQEEVSSSFSSADVIIDMSASVSVARYLSFSIDNDTRRVSVFMTPTGADLVLIAEDEHRFAQLDTLEMQYYRACVHNDHLKGHLESSPTHLRYGQSCRDLASRLPQHLVALHAAIAAKAIMDMVTKPEAQIVIWRSKDDGTVSRVDISPGKVTIIQSLGWTVTADEGLLTKLQDLRQRKLPDETGGVLLGSIDLDHRVIYIVDTIPSPPDSEEWPTHYIRGSRTLRTKVKEAEAATDGMLEYIGEWHSHPQDVNTIPSNDDIKVFTWITAWMDRDGLPALMMIVGDPGCVSCFVAEIEQRENLLPTKGVQ